MLPRWSGIRFLPVVVLLLLSAIRAGAGTESIFDSDFESGSICTSGWSANFGAIEDCPTCGDGVVEGVEECDDGLLFDGDGCSHFCTEEHGWECAGEPSVCFATCGDGLIAAGVESCDDGSLFDGDGCSQLCELEAGWSCGGEPTSCTSICGDSLIVGSEECDDGDSDETDGCTTYCRTGSVCTASAFPTGDRFATDPVTATCYLSFDGDQVGFADAASSCSGLGGHLATITSAGEQQFVDSVRNSSETPWVGGTDADVEGAFEWITGEPFLYVHWLAGEPDDDSLSGGNGDCIALAGSGEWLDTRCSFVGFVAGYICEVPAP